MTNDRKKEWERLIFETWRRTCPELEGFDAVEDESPDFVVPLEFGRLGVEVTLLVEPSSAKEGDAVARLFNTLEQGVKASSQPVVVSAALKSSIRSGRRADELAREVLSLVEPNLALPGSSAHFSRLGGTPRLAKELLDVEVHWPPSLKQPFVLLSGMGYCVTNHFANQIRERLSAKEEKRALYRERCDRCWLLIELPHTHEVVDGQGRTPVLDEVYETSFERVFLVSASTEQAWELQVRSGSAQ